MKKIMFSERFGLEQAVLAGTKTMTRRIIIGLRPQYEIGERVAIAQPYKNDDVLTYNAYNEDGTAREDGLQRHKEMLDSKGYRNKMFVKAEYMPLRIHITGIKVERLQDISDEDAMREGIRLCVVEYGDKKIVQWTYFGEKITTWYNSPREAFAALIDRISGRGTWQSNPWVYAYTFELIK